LSIFSATAEAQTVTWGVNGAGGSGNWNTSTANWFTGSQNVIWPSGGNAVFGGASGGTVTSFFFGPVVSSMTFNTPGYVIQDGWVNSGTSGLTVTTNVDATINSTLSNSASTGSSLVKNGSAALVLGGTNFLSTVQVNQGELRATGTSSLAFSDVTLANTPGATVTLAPSATSIGIGSLAGGGTFGGVVHPDNQARTVTVSIGGSGTFGGTLADNGSGILAVSVGASSGTPTLTNANTYSGATKISGNFAFAGNGSALNSPISITPFGKFVLDDSVTPLANRISDSRTLSMDNGSLQLKGNSATSVEEVVGQLSLSGPATITVTQPTPAAAAQLTSAGLQRNGHATLNVVGPGFEIAGVSNGATGIVAPYVTAGTEWATVGGDSRITPLTSYAPDINAAVTSDHVKLTTTGTTTLAAPTTRASLNLQNSTSVGQVLDLAGQNLELSTGGILSSGAGASTIRNGSLSTAAREMVITTSNSLSISSQIVDNGGATTLTKSGPGVLTLSGPNTYSGPTAIVQGTLVVASDANLGLGSTVAFGGGTLKAAASFSSAKGFTSEASLSGTIDTGGFDVTLSGPISGGLAKTGLGTLTMTGTPPNSLFLSAGAAAFPNGNPQVVFLQGGRLQVAGTLPFLDCSFADSTAILDIGGPAAATLTTQSFNPSHNGSLRINFGIGSGHSDFWAASSLFPSPGSVGAFQFEFQNLGGVATGVDYPLMSFFTFPAPSPSFFAFAPDMAAAGWAGTFTTTTNGVSVRFSAVPVPEPNMTAVLLLQGAALAFIGRRSLRTRMTTRATSAGARSRR
jgi:fibronectin-binding autotransporter adhesin